MSSRLNVVGVKPAKPGEVAAIVVREAQLMRLLVDGLVEVAVLVRQPVVLAPFEIEVGRDVRQRQGVIDIPVDLRANQRRVPLALLGVDRPQCRVDRQVPLEPVVPWIRVRECLAFRVCKVALAQQVGGVALATFDVSPEMNVDGVSR